MEGLSDIEILEAKALGILFDILVLQHASRGRIISRQFLANFDSLVVTEAGELTVANGGVTVADANGPSRVRKMVKGALFAVFTGGALAIAAFGVVAAPIPKHADPYLRKSYQNYLDLRRALKQSPLPPDPADIFLDDNLVTVQGNGKEAIEDLINTAKKLKKKSFDVLKFYDQEYLEILQNEVTANRNMILLKQVTMKYDRIKAENASWYGEEPGFVGKVWRWINAKDKESYKKELESLEQEEKLLSEKIGDINKDFVNLIRQFSLEDVKDVFSFKEHQDELIEITNFKSESGPDHEAKMDQAFIDQLNATVIAHLVNASNLPFTNNGFAYANAVLTVAREVTPLVYAKCKKEKKNGKTCSSLYETIELYRDIADDYFRNFTMGSLLEVQDIAIRTRILIGTTNSTIKYVFGENASHPTLDVLELELENFITTMLLTCWKDYGYWTAYGVSISIPTVFGALIASYGYETMVAPGLTGEPTPALEIKDGNTPPKPSSVYKNKIIVLDRSGNEHFITMGAAIKLFFPEEGAQIANNIPNFKQLFIQFTNVMYECYSNPKHTESKKNPFPFGFSIVYNPKTKRFHFADRKAAIVFRNTLLMILKTTRDEKKLKPLFVYDAFSIFVEFALGPYLGKPDETAKRNIRSHMKESYSQKIAGPYYEEDNVIGPWVNRNTVDPEGKTVGERLGKMEVYLYNEGTSTPLFTKKGEDAFVAFYGNRERAEKFDPEEKNQELVDYLLNLAEAARLKIESPKNLLT